MNLKSIISRAIDDVSYKTTSGMVNLNDTYHLHMVQEELKKHIDPNVVNMLFEADDSPKELSDADKEKIKDLKFIKGSQPPSWSKDGKLPAVYVNDNGKLSKPESGEKDGDSDNADKLANTLTNTSKDDEPPTDQEIQTLSDYEENYRTKPGSEKSTRNAKNGSKFKGVKAQVDEMPDGDKKKNAQELIRLLEAFCDAKTPDDREKIILEMVEKGLITRNAPGTNTVKFYIDPKTDLDYKAFGENTALHQAICAYDKKNRDEGGPGLIPTLKEGNMGGKKVNPGGILGEEAVIKVKLKKNKDGSVEMDGVTYKKQPHPDDNPKFKKKLEEATKYLFREMYGKGTPEYKNAVIALERGNEIINRFEDVLVSGGELEVFNPFHPEEHVPPNTPENRKKLRNVTGQKMIDTLKRELEAMGKEITPEHQAIFDKLKALENLSGEKYENAAMEIVTMLNKHPDTSRGVADIYETFSYMIALGNDKAAYLPSAGNFPLGDVLAASTADIDVENDSPEEIANKIQFIITSIENRSVKKGGGAASSSHKKNSLTKYKDGVDANGDPLSGEQIAIDTQDMTDTNFARIYGGKDANGNKVEKDLDKAGERVKEYAKKYGVDITSEEYLAKRNSSVSAAMNAVNNKRLEAKPPLPLLLVGSPEYDEMQQQMEILYDNGKVYEKVYNERFESQYFTNDNCVLDKHGNATRDTTDGICKVSEVKFEFNVGFNKHGKPGNKMPTRFHNINRCEA